MMLFTGYKSRKELKENIVSTGTFVGALRPLVTGLPGREFFAEVTMENDLIVKVK